MLGRFTSEYCSGLRVQSPLNEQTPQIWRADWCHPLLLSEERQGLTLVPVQVQHRVLLEGKVCAQDNFSPDTLIPHAKFGLCWELPSPRSRPSAGSALRLGSGSAGSPWEGTCKHSCIPRVSRGRGYNKVTFWHWWIFQVLMSAKRQRLWMPISPTSQISSVQSCSSCPFSALPTSHPLQPRAALPIHALIQCCPLSPTSNPALARSINSAARHFVMYPS